jgi:hypothetical protein
MRTALWLLSVIILSAVTTAIGAESALQTELKDPALAANWIYDDLPKAMAEGKATGKPILVELRCVPCPPGKKMDSDVTHPDAELEKLENNFVCVRVIQTNGLDLKLFQYDYDQSVTFLFLDADGTIYGRYGTRNGMKERSEDFLSIASFRKSAERALELHKGYPANKESLMGKLGGTPPYRVPEEIPGLTDKPHTAVERESCIHCHMVKDAILRAKWSEKKLRPIDLYTYPLPNNIGITMDVDDGLRVKSVASDSPAARAGLAGGDELVSLNGQPLISIADIQWVLNNLPDETKLAAKVLRDGKTIDQSISLSGDWRHSDLGWRKSTRGLGHGVFITAMSQENKMKRGIAPGDLALNVRYMFAPDTVALAKAGLKVGDVIVAVDGKTASMPEGDFLVNLRLTHGPGDSFKATILRGTERQELTLPLW